MENLRHVEYTTSGVCARMISFDLDENDNIHNLGFLGGCSGNLRAISKLVEGKNAIEIANILGGNKCGPRNTSCADQLSKAILEAINTVDFIKRCIIYYEYKPEEIQTDNGTEFTYKYISNEVKTIR